MIVWGEVGGRQRCQITNEGTKPTETNEEDIGSGLRDGRVPACGGRDRPFVRPRSLRSFVVNSVVFVRSERLSIDHRDLAIGDRLSSSEAGASIDSGRPINRRTLSPSTRQRL
jgi:hypothetical protein